VPAVVGPAGKVAFVATRESLGLDDGWRLLRDAIISLGLEPSVAVYDDPTVRWAAFDLVVPMYAWGYVNDRPGFLRWAATVSGCTRLVNSAPVLDWNSDKVYLADLDAAGIRIVPTTWVPPGGSWEPPAGDYVIKPCVASGGIGAARYVAQGIDVAERHVRRLHDEGQTVMVQPYVPSVATDGETSLVFLGDRYSHAVTKGAVLDADVGVRDRLWERQVVTAGSALRTEQELAADVLRLIHGRFGATAYARVDLVDLVDGKLAVLEVELIEPCLFLTLAAGSARHLAERLQRCLDG
jgi:glutathione synthase/RimK-type ligase-like ATP-grasp enzyme